ncbi:MAG: deoxyribonuclease IV [Clostridia bacterium]|nr:deoxyribonuclease IV [Clostridia bacterium]
MINIGCHLSIASGYEKMGKDALSIGANTLAFFTRNPRGGKAKEIDPNDVEKFLKLARENNFAKLVAHAPYTLNPASKDEKTRNFALMAMTEDLERMEYTPGNYYNFHPGSHVGQGAEKGIELIAGLLNQVLKEDQTTTVLLETMAGKGSEVGATFEEIREIIDKVELKEKIGVCLDTCHVSDGGYDIIGDLDGVLDHFDEVIGLKYLKALHINDSKNPMGSHKDRHAKIGEGFLGLETIVEVVKNPRLKGLPMILETPQESLDGYRKEIETLREKGE